MGMGLSHRSASFGVLRSPEEVMDPRRLRELLEGVRLGGTSIDDALTELRNLPYSDLGYAAVDNNRTLRQGAPEVVFDDAKTAGQIVGITRELAEAAHHVLC